MTQQSSKRKRGMISLVQFFEEHMSWIEPWPYIMKLICLIQWTLGLFNYFFFKWVPYCTKQTTLSPGKMAILADYIQPWYIQHF